MAFKLKLPKLSFRLEELSLRAQLRLVFMGLMAIAVTFSALLLFEQHRAAIRGAEIAVRAHDEMVNVIQMRESLTEVDRRARQGEVPAAELARFRGLMDRLEHSIQSPESIESFINLRQRFERYVDSLSATRGPGADALVRSRYEDLAAAVGAFIQMDEDSVYRMADYLRRDQEKIMRYALFFLVAFLMIIVVAAYKIISVITQPLSSLVRFLDQVDVEDDLPSTSVLPEFKSVVPEISHVARAFDQVLHRLRGYRALNVRRLLIEKRRADIIAASISDGVILLRGEEILYLNPVAEKILGTASGSLPRGATIQSIIEKAMPGEPGESQRNGARAVLDAVSRTIPVEFSVQNGESRSSYLIQSYPISYDVIEQIEHNFAGPGDEVLDRFQANTLVVAQDVTLVRDSQEAKSHFIATLSHEIKTPVTSLTMATRLLRKSIAQIPNAAHQSLIQTCADDVDRLRGLLEDLLNVSGFDTLTQRLEMQHIDLGKLVRHAAQSFRFQATERGVELSSKVVNPAGKPVVVPMDPTKVSWALSNLITNAIRHTPKGGKVETEVQYLDEVAEIRIRDTGPGIERKRQQRIFDKFNPFYDIRVARSGGAGVGLAIAREIVIAHGGRIWVQSEPGHGAEFCFTLPLKRGGSLSSDQVDSNSNPSMKTVISSLKGAPSGASTRS